MTRYRVTLANLVNENKHVTEHKDLETAERYKQNAMIFYGIQDDRITIEAIEDEGEPNE